MTTTTITMTMDRDSRDDGDGPYDNVLALDPTSPSTSMLSTTVVVNDAHQSHHSMNDDAGFDIEVICAENEIFKGEWTQSLLFWS